MFLSFIKTVLFFLFNAVLARKTPRKYSRKEFIELQNSMKIDKIDFDLSKILQKPDSSQMSLRRTKLKSPKIKNKEAPDFQFIDLIEHIVFPIKLE